VKSSQYEEEDIYPDFPYTPCESCYLIIEKTAVTCPHCNETCSNAHEDPPEALLSYPKNHIAILVGPPKRSRPPVFFEDDHLAKWHCEFYNNMTIAMEHGGNEQAWKDDENSVSWEYWSREQYAKTFGSDECAKAFGE